MDKKLAGLIGAASAVAAFSGAQAATPATPPDVETAMKAESFADLLTPIPNAVSVLHAMDAAAAKMPAAVKSDEAFDSKVAQFYYREHHHHHHGYWRRPRFYHHHHHHGYWRPRFYHHHHHHHHSYYRY